MPDRRFGRTAYPPSTSTLLVRERIEESIAAKQALLSGDVPDLVAECADRVVDSLRDGGKVLLFGNGGSAADATHLAAEFVGRFRLDRAPLPALSLSDNGSSVSGIGNDYDYADVFARQVEAFGRPGDVAIGLSTSGRSPNVLAGLRAARSNGLHAVGITGRPGGGMPDVADVCLHMPSDDTARIQECYMLVGHIVCELVEQAMFAEP